MSKFAGTDPRREVVSNAAPARLYELGVVHERASITASGALATFSGEKTGRSPKDKRIVENPESKGDVWWGSVNIPISHDSLHDLPPAGASTSSTDATASTLWTAMPAGTMSTGVKVRVLCTQAYHALFMHNMHDPAHAGGADELRRPRFRDLQRRRACRPTSESRG